MTASSWYPAFEEQVSQLVLSQHAPRFPECEEGEEGDETHHHLGEGVRPTFIQELSPDRCQVLPLDPSEDEVLENPEVEDHLRHSLAQTCDLIVVLLEVLILIPSTTTIRHLPIASDDHRAILTSIGSTNENPRGATGLRFLASQSPRRSARWAPSHRVRQILADRCCRRSAAWVISAAGH
jgi:hypothetical protein